MGCVKIFSAMDEQRSVACQFCRTRDEEKTRSPCFELISGWECSIFCLRPFHCDTPAEYEWPGPGRTWCQCSSLMTAVSTDRGAPAAADASSCSNCPSCGDPPAAEGLGTIHCKTIEFAVKF